MTRIRRRTHCHVPGHGTRCYAVWERGDDGSYYRSTEERIALQYEIAASGWVTTGDSSWEEGWERARRIWFTPTTFTTTG